MNLREGLDGVVGALRCYAKASYDCGSITIAIFATHNHEDHRQNEQRCAHVADIQPAVGSVQKAGEEVVPGWHLRPRFCAFSTVLPLVSVKASTS